MSKFHRFKNISNLIERNTIYFIEIYHSLTQYNYYLKNKKTVFSIKLHNN